MIFAATLKLLFIMHFTRKKWKLLSPDMREFYRQRKHARRAEERQEVARQRQAARVTARRSGERSGSINGGSGSNGGNNSSNGKSNSVVKKQIRKPCVGACPGDQLEGMLKWLGFKSGDNCACRRHSREMNRRGVKWCSRNVGMIVGWLKAEADKRPVAKKLFAWKAVEAIVWRAIRRAERAGNKLEAANLAQQQQEQQEVGGDNGKNGKSED
jgi:hypothetical protein